jgi:hypothetical protein
VRATSRNSENTSATRYFICTEGEFDSEGLRQHGNDIEDLGTCSGPTRIIINPGWIDTASAPGSQRSPDKAILGL